MPTDAADKLCPTLDKEWGRMVELDATRRRPGGEVWTYWPAFAALAAAFISFLWARTFCRLAWSVMSATLRKTPFLA